MKRTVKIIGFGWVGKAMHQLFPDAAIYDPIQGIFNSTPTDISFICVPTPLNYGTLDCTIVEEAVAKCDSPLIVIRSTVMPGTCDRLISKYNRDIIFQPEYLGETVQHPLTDQFTRPFMILGGIPRIRKEIIELYQEVYNANIRIRQVSCYEAEVIKLSENRAIAFKVAQCQELYDACIAAGIDYETIRQAVYGDDPRFNLWWTFVYPDKRGFNSKCIPKDVYGWKAWAESLGIEVPVTRSILKKNEQYIGG